MKNVIEELRKWGNNEESSLNRGYSLCANLSAKLDISPTSIKHLFHRWVYFSYDFKYPVPSPTPGISAKEEWSKQLDNNSFWEGEQGELRRSLCLFLADELEKAYENTK